VLSIGLHVTKIGEEGIHQVPCFLPKPTIPRDIARILVGSRFCNPLVRIYLNTPISHIFVKESHAMNNRNWGLTAGQS
jgi:hypothetical protein